MSDAFVRIERVDHERGVAIVRNLDTGQEGEVPLDKLRAENKIGSAPVEYVIHVCPACGYYETRNGERLTFSFRCPKHESGEIHHLEAMSMYAMAVADE